MYKLATEAYSYKSAEETINFLSNSTKHKFLGLNGKYTVKFLTNRADQSRHTRGQQSILVSLWNNRHEILSYVELTPISFNGIKGYEASGAGVSPAAIGKNMGLKLYQYLINKLGMTIWSGKEQTPKSRRLWVKLSRSANVSVHLINETHIEKIKSNKDDKEISSKNILAYDCNGKISSARLIASGSSSVTSKLLQNIIKDQQRLINIIPKNPFDLTNLKYLNPKYP